MRLANRPLAFILAAALIALSVVVICEVIGVAAHHSPLLVPWTTWYRWAAKTTWNAGAVRVWAGVLITVGLVILAAELKPARVTRLPVRPANEATEPAVTRRGLAGMLRAAATSVDGITSATVKVGRRRARVTAASAARGRDVAGALKAPVTQALNERLDQLGLRHPPRLAVRVVPGRS